MKRSKHSLSHYKLLTMDMGYLIPLTWYEALPGDTIQQSTSALIRVSPLLSPVMHPVVVRIHHWFVPLRLIWDTFTDFITGGEDGTDSTTPPYITLASNTEGTLWDYLGVPVETFGKSMDLSALPVRAYNLIHNEYYRDQDLVTAQTIDTTDGVDTTTNTDLLRVAWEKDYFTTARPWEQKGDAVTIPLGDTADVVADSSGIPRFSINGQANFLRGQSSSADTNWDYSVTSGGQAEWDDPHLEVDLSGATGIDINDLRLALALQRYQEARAQYGSRYTEYLRYLGVKSSDSRLQRPEFIGGGRQTIQFSEVLQTAEGTDPVGSLKGHGMAAMRSNRARKFYEEHGICMTLMSVLPKAIYTQNLSRGFTRTVKEDYYQRELESIGEQEIPNYEALISHTSPDGVFGYQARYDEYRSIPSSIAGEFRSTLDHWHLSRIHSGDIALNSSYISSTPTKRVFASTGTDCLYVLANHSIQARRMLSSRAKTRTF